MGLFNRGKKPSEQANALSQNGTSLVQHDSHHPGAASELVSLSDMFLPETQIDTGKAAITLPIGQLATLGPAAASLLPAFRTVTETVSVDTTGLFRVANASVGDVLKAAKDGNFWGAMKRTDGTSKMAKFAQADPMSGTSTKVMPVDPATMMMAAALYTIEQKLDAIEEISKQILSFLENEKEAQIEADVKILQGTIREFKFNWDKELFKSGHYKQALDIKRTAEKNLQAYQNELQEIKVKAPVVANANVNAVVKSLLKKFRYYRMSLYLFAMSSFVEVMLLGDFREEHLEKIRNDIEERSMRYRQIYAACSAYIEKIAGKAVEGNLLKGIGNAGKALGSFIGSIPLVKEGPVDEWLIDGGAALKKNAKGMEGNLVHALTEVSNPGTGMFIEKMDTLGKLCNHTSSICVDRDNLYLMAS